MALVPSSQHEHLVEMFRTRGELAPALLELCGALALPHDQAELAPSDLSQPTPTEYRADAVIELRGRGRRLVAAVVVEIQLRRDPVKRFSWPVYLAALRAKRKCDVVLFVLTARPEIARWARTPIKLGHPGFTLQPIAISLEDLPRSISREQLRNVPELAVLSALAHRDADAAVSAIRAIDRLPTEQTKLYSELILTALPDEVRRTVEARVKGYVFKSEWVRKHFIEPVERAKAEAIKVGLARGRQVGLEQGVKQGRQQGRQQGVKQGLQRGVKQGLRRGVKQGLQQGVKRGREEGLQHALTVLIRDKLKAVPRAYQAAIRDLDDPRALTSLISAVGRAKDAEHARQVLGDALLRLARRRRPSKAN